MLVSLGKETERRTLLRNEGCGTLSCYECCEGILVWPATARRICRCVRKSLPPASNTIMMPHTPNALTDLFAQFRNAIITGDIAAKGSKGDVGPKPVPDI